MSDDGGVGPVEADPDLPGWPVVMAPLGWWAVLVESRTDKQSVPSSRPGTRHGTSSAAARVTTTRHTLRSIALPTTPRPGTGLDTELPLPRCEIVLSWAAPYATGDLTDARDDEPAAGVPFQLDGRPFQAQLTRPGPGRSAWQAEGTVMLPADGPPVSVQVRALGETGVLTEWTSLPGSTLLARRDLWLSPL